MHPSSLFSLSDHLDRLSKDGDPLEVLDGTVDFERFRDLLVDGLGYRNGAKGGRPPFDPVAMFKVLVVQAQHNLSDARMEFMIRDRLSWTPAKTPRFEASPVIHSVHWTESFDAPTQPVFAVGAPGAAKQGRRPTGGFVRHGRV